MRAEAGIAKKTHRKGKRRRRHSRRATAADTPLELLSNQEQKNGRKIRHDRHDADEVDLEADLGHRNRHVH